MAEMGAMESPDDPEVAGAVGPLGLLGAPSWFHELQPEIRPSLEITRRS